MLRTYALGLLYDVCASRLVGAYLAGVFLSDALAYKSNSAGFKRGKVRWNKLHTKYTLFFSPLSPLFGKLSETARKPEASAVLFVVLSRIAACVSTTTGDFSTLLLLCEWLVRSASLALLSHFQSFLCGPRHQYTTAP